MYGRILVGTDGSASADRAVARAVELARATGATVAVMAVGPPAKAAPVVRRAVDAHAGSGVALEALTEDGDPADVLVAAADRFDLLVVGNRGMGALSRLFGRSVPRAVSHQAPTPILIVHTS